MTNDPAPVEAWERAFRRWLDRLQQEDVWFRGYPITMTQYLRGAFSAGALWAIGQRQEEPR